MTNSHFLQTTLGRIGLGLLMGLFLFASSGWGAVAHAQVTDVDLNRDFGSDLKEAVNKGIDDVGEEAEEGLTEAIDDAVSEKVDGSGSSIPDAAIEGAAGALAELAGCAIAALIEKFASEDLAEAGEVVPVRDEAVGRSTGTFTLKECFLDGFISGLKQGSHQRYYQRHDHLCE